MASARCKPGKGSIREKQRPTPVRCDKFEPLAVDIRPIDHQRDQADGACRDEGGKRRPMLPREKQKHRPDQKVRFHGHDDTDEKTRPDPRSTLKQQPRCNAGENQRQIDLPEKERVPESG